MPFDVSSSFLVLVGVTAVAGAIGGLMGGRSPGAILSALMGIVGGLAVAAVARAYGAPPLVQLEGWSVVYSAVGAALFALVVSLSSGRR